MLLYKVDLYVTSAVFPILLLSIFINQRHHSGGDSLLFLNITFPATNIDTGTYVTGLANGFLYSTLSGTVIYKKLDAHRTNQVEIHIINYDAVNKIVTGSLFGKTEDGSGKRSFINKGVFKAKGNIIKKFWAGFSFSWHRTLRRTLCTFEYIAAT